MYNRGTVRPRNLAGFANGNGLAGIDDQFKDYFNDYGPTDMRMDGQVIGGLLLTGGSLGLVTALIKKGKTQNMLGKFSGALLLGGFAYGGLSMIRAARTIPKMQ